jgi:hypothetical protein
MLHFSVRERFQAPLSRIDPIRRLIRGEARRVNDLPDKPGRQHCLDISTLDVEDLPWRATGPRRAVVLEQARAR